MKTHAQKVEKAPCKSGCCFFHFTRVTCEQGWRDTWFESNVRTSESKSNLTDQRETPNPLRGKFDQNWIWSDWNWSPFLHNNFVLFLHPNLFHRTFDAIVCSCISWWQNIWTFNAKLRQSYEWKGGTDGRLVNNKVRLRLRERKGGRID